MTLDYFMYYLGILFVPIPFIAGGNLLQYEGGFWSSMVFILMGVINYGLVLSDKNPPKLNKQLRKLKRE